MSRLFKVAKFENAALTSVSAFTARVEDESLVGKYFQSVIESQTAEKSVYEEYLFKDDYDRRN